MKVTPEMIDPELRKAARLYKRFMDLEKPISWKRMNRLKPMIRLVSKPKLSRKREVFIQTPDNPRLRICVFTPNDMTGDAVGLLWLHGGGYGMGEPDQDGSIYDVFMNAANCVVIAPDYRLAPKNPYPAPLNDGYNTLLWMRDHAADLGIRSDQLFVAGNSAGGGMTAAVSLLARDKGEVSVAFQMPFYPMINNKMDTYNYEDNNAPVVDTAVIDLAWRWYVGPNYKDESVSKYAAPMLETDYANLPPTYTFVGSLEPFVGDAEEYVSRLRSAGVTADVDVYDGCFHAFDFVCPKSKKGSKAIEAYAQRFAYAAEHFHAPQPQASAE